MKKRDNWQSTTYICPNCDEEVEVLAKPERPAPACSNHDSPAFSDSGDCGDIEYPDSCPFCGEDLMQYEEAIYEHAMSRLADWYDYDPLGGDGYDD